MKKVINSHACCTRNKYGIKRLILGNLTVKKVALVINVNNRLIGCVKILNNLLGYLNMLGYLGIVYVRNDKKNIRIGNLVKGRLKGLNKVVRKLSDKANGVGQKNILTARKLKLSCCRVKGCEKLVLGKNSCACKRIKESGLSCIGITNEGNLGKTASVTLGTHYCPVMLHLCKTLLKSNNLFLHMSAVALKL